MGNIRELNFSGSKHVIIQSIINHRNDLWEYIDNYENLKYTERVLPIESAMKRLNITNMIYNNREVVC